MSAWCRFVVEEDLTRAAQAYELIKYVHAVSEVDFTTIPYEDEDTVMADLLSKNVDLPSGTSIWDVIKRHILPITVFGSGVVDLVAKVCNLMWCILLELGFCFSLWEKYRCSVVSNPV